MSTPLATCWNWICNRFRRLFFPLLLRYVAKKLKGGSVFRLTPWTVVKSGSVIAIAQEAEGLQFIRQHTKIPVPRLYDMWHQAGEEDPWIAMEYIDGERVDRSQRPEVNLTVDQKKTICRILGGYIDELRAIEQPQSLLGQVCSPSGGWSQDFRFGSAVIPAFNTVKDYHDWRISTFACWGEMHAPTARRLKELRAAMDDNCRVFFTHGDVNKKNVLIRRSGDGPEDVQVVALLDWEQCGWRPEYWEVAKIGFTSRHTDWWMDISPDYRRELDIESELICISGPPR